MRRPTIKDVAKMAGVTYPTVSRVLGNKPYVAAETREKVMQAVEALGYRPSAAARSMITNRTETIAMLVPQLTDPNFGMMVSGAEREARSRGYSVLVAGFLPAEDEYHFLAEHRVDGIVLVEPYRYGSTGEAQAPIPTVSMDQVPIDNRGGGRDLAEHLRSLGHEQVVFLGGPADSPYSLDRYAGVREVLPTAPWLDGDWTAASGYDLTSRAFAESTYTAVIAANDFVAFGAIHALRDLSLDVPADVSVTGFDDVTLARHFNPPLTTVAQDLEDQGARAAALLLDQLDGLETKAVNPIHLPVVKRGSTASVRPDASSPKSGRNARPGVKEGL
jgi:DNA-binding LacI/PurR family transcriptional regulator